MNIKPFIVILVAFCIVILPIHHIYGATFLAPSNEVASIRSEIEGDVYTAGNSVVITAPINGDIFAAGESVDVSGSSSASIFAIGRNITITGDAQDDVRIAGDILSVDSNIAHDLFAAGSTLLVAKDSHVHGDAYLAGEQITISGTIHGNLYVASSKLTIATGATVMGNITVRGEAPIIEDQATVSGKVKTIAPKVSDSRGQTGFQLNDLFVSIVSSAILALALLFAAPIIVVKSKEYIINSPMQSGLTGLVWLIVFIPAFIMLIVSGIGAHIGIIILFATLLTLMIGFGVMIIATGSIVYQLFAKKEGIDWQHCIIGAVLVAVVSLLNFIGFIALAFGFIVSFGALLKAFWTLIQGK